MKINGLDDAEALQKRGADSLLFMERKKRLDGLYAEYRKYQDLAQQDDELKDVQAEIIRLMDEIEEINKMKRELKAA